MKRSIVLLGVMSMLAFASCSNNNTKEADKSTPPPAQQTPPPAPPQQQEGTTIKVNDGGVSIENKDGAKKSNVQITKDSTKIEITKPK